MIEHIGKLLILLAPSVILAFAAHRVFQARAFTKTPIQNHELHVIYTVRKRGCRFRVNFGFLAVEGSQVVLYDEQRNDILEQPLSDLTARYWIAQGPEFEMKSRNNMVDEWWISLASYWAFEPDKLHGQTDRLAELLRNGGAEVQNYSSDIAFGHRKKQKTLLTVLVILIITLILLQSVVRIVR